MNEHGTLDGIDEWAPHVVADAQRLLDNTSTDNPLHHAVQNLVCAIKCLPAYIEHDRKAMSTWLKAEADKAEADYTARAKEYAGDSSVSDKHGTLSLLLGKKSFAWYLWGAFGSKFKVS